MKPPIFQQAHDLEYKELVEECTKKGLDSCCSLNQELLNLKDDNFFSEKEKKEFYLKITRGINEIFRYKKYGFDEMLNEDLIAFVNQDADVFQEVYSQNKKYFTKFHKNYPDLEKLKTILTIVDTMIYSELRRREG